MCSFLFFDVFPLNSPLKSAFPQYEFTEWDDFSIFFFLYSVTRRKLSGNLPPAFFFFLPFSEGLADSSNSDLVGVTVCLGVFIITVCAQSTSTGKAEMF